MRSITVNASKTYNVLVGGGLLPGAGDEIIKVCSGETAMLITDDAVEKLYADSVEQSLKNAGYTTGRFVFSHGEQSKNMETYVSLMNAMTGANLTRSDVVVALGGGVTGDLAGFAAATYQRGIKFVQIPTTVLAMVDSSVGGKTAVNLTAGKNQAGAFYQPDLVMCDYETLKTLPQDIFIDGCAEMVKHGVIQSAELFEMLKKPLEPQIEDIIARNIMIKRDIVEKDERDTGIRQLLNFGHTIGHGIEKHSGYSISHGKAVAIGMAITSRAAWRMGVCEKRCHTEIVDALMHLGLPYTTDIPPESLFEASFSDKKRNGQSITEVLPERIGKCKLHNFSMDELAAFIKLGTEE